MMTTLNTIFGSLAERFKAWRERERAYAELSSLDDHTLADLGLRRSDIPLVLFDKQGAPGSREGFDGASGRFEPANSNDGRYVA